MDREEGSGSDAGAPDVLGLSVEAAVDAVLASEGSGDGDRGTVRATLERVAEDGVVTEAALEDELGELSKVVSTPETRVEFAAMELDDAAETAEEEGVSDLDVVRTRLEGFRARLDAVRADVDELGPELRELVDGWRDANAYRVAAGIRELEAEANDCHHAADELQVDVEEFGRWLADPAVRYDDFEEDLDAVGASLDGLAGTADDLAAVGTDGDTADPAPGLPAAPEVVWADASLRTGVTGLLLRDLRTEFEDLRAWPEGKRGDADRLEELGDRLGELEGRCRALDGRLEELARPPWVERFGDRLGDFEAAVDGFEPPVSWGEVEAELERHREALEPTD